MSISDAKIQAALVKIESKRKEKFTQSSIKNCEDIESIQDPVLKLKKLMGLKDMFVMIAQTNNDNTEELYNDIVDSISHAIDEHVNILTQHVKEVTQPEKSE